MAKIILIDAELKAEYDNLQSLLSSSLEFLYRYKDSVEPHILEEKKTVTIDKIWNYQLRMLDLQKKMYRGEILI